MKTWYIIDVSAGRITRTIVSDAEPSIEQLRQIGCASLGRYRVTQHPPVAMLRSFTSIPNP